MRGFNKAVDGFNQLNLIMLDDGSVNAGGMLIANPPAGVTLTNAFLKNVFATSPMKKDAVSLSP